MNTIQSPIPLYESPPITHQSPLTNHQPATVMVRGRGAHCWDDLGREYIEYTACRGPILLGYSNEDVDGAVRKQMQSGILLPLGNSLVEELKRKLVGLFTWAEAADLKKTGSDATTAAVRLARSFTGREKVVRAGYHGWHDWAAQKIGTVHRSKRKPNGWVPQVRGVPRSAVDGAVFNWNGDDVGYIEELFRRHPGEFACVIVAADEVLKPVDARLHDLRRVTQEHGVIFILDEIKTAFRTSLGGVQGLYGVSPDLTTVSKAMANGYPIAAVLGRQEIMDCLKESHIFTTFQHDLLSVAAALKTIEILETSDALGHLWSLGRRLIDGFNEIAKDLDLSDHVEAEGWQWETMPFFFFTKDDERTQLMKKRFHEELRAGGVLMSPDHMDFIMAAHTVEDIDKTLSVCEESLRVAKNQ